MNRHDTIGVVVGRFQVDSLHQGHLHLLQTVLAQHERVLVCLGVTPSRTRHDPLDFLSRSKMISAVFPTAAVVPLLDIPGNDQDWSRQLDRTIRTVFPNGEPILYGARGSFLPHYHGLYQTREIYDGPDGVSGSERRQAVAAEIRDSADFRAGQIHALANQRTPWWPCVDIAVLRATGEVLMAQKEHEIKSGRYRFVGGMVDDTDRTVWEAARRELAEETGIEADNLQEVGTFINDSERFVGVKIVTTLFLAHYVFGSTFKPMDDIAVLDWIPLRRIQDYVFPFHRQLAEAVLKTNPALGAPCAPVCSGFQYHQLGCPKYEAGVYIQVAPA